MTSQTPSTPEEQAEIDAELGGARGETLVIGRFVPPVAVESAPQNEPKTPALSLRFSPPPDAPFKSSVSVEILCDSPDACIHYALGSDSVDENGFVFDAKDPILLTQSTLVSARAFQNGEFGSLLSTRFEVVKPAWQELEPADQSDAATHKIGEHLACNDGWKVAAGSVRGKLHAHRGSWREDSFGLAQVEKWSVIAVSDGAGSAPLSRVGSKEACAAAIAALRDSLGALNDLAGEQDELVARDLPLLKATLVAAGVAALRAIESQSQTRGKPLTAFAATLLLLVRHEWNGAQLCAGLQVGDGAIALWDGTEVTLLGEADHGQSSGETRFLTTHGIEDELAARVRFSIKRDLQACAVMTDGVSDDFFPEGVRLGEVFAATLPLAQEAENAGTVLMSWLGYEKRGSSDDRTLVLSWYSNAQSGASGGE